MTKDIKKPTIPEREYLCGLLKDIYPRGKWLELCRKKYLLSILTEH